MFWIVNSGDGSKHPHRVIQAETGDKAVSYVCGIELDAVGEAKGNVVDGPFSEEEADFRLSQIEEESKPSEGMVEFDDLMKSEDRLFHRIRKAAVDTLQQSMSSRSGHFPQKWEVKSSLAFQFKVDPALQNEGPAADVVAQINEAVEFAYRRIEKAGSMRRAEEARRRWQTMTNHLSIRRKRSLR